MGSSVILPVPGQPKTGPDPSFKTSPQSALVSFGFDKVSPPSQVYIQRDDFLTITSTTQLVADQVFITARILQPAGVVPGQPDVPQPPPGSPDALVGRGRVQVMQQLQSTGTGGAVGSASFQLMEGYLLSVSVVSLNATFRGQTFVRGWLNQGRSTLNPTTLQTLLFGDYVTINEPIGWPYGRTISGAEGPGFLQIYTVPNPLAGADWTFLTTDAGRTRVAGLTAKFTASAAVANRFPQFTLRSAAIGQNEYVIQEPTAITANQTVTYSLAPGATNVRGGGSPFFETLPIPSPYIARGQVNISTTTQGIQAADTWTVIIIDTELWLDFI